jgi:hypothetical protein
MMITYYMVWLLGSLIISGINLVRGGHVVLDAELQVRGSLLKFVTVSRMKL